MLKKLLKPIGLFGVLFSCTVPISAIFAQEAAIPSSSLPVNNVVNKITLLQVDKTQATKMAEGITRRFFHTKNGTVSILELKKGAIVKKHAHPNEQITYIVSGAVEVTCPGRKPIIVRGGQALVLPPNNFHEFKALEDTTDIDFFSPAREDWKRGEEGYLKGEKPTSTKK